MSKTSKGLELKIKVTKYRKKQATVHESAEATHYKVSTAKTAGSTVVGHRKQKYMCV